MQTPPKFSTKGTIRCKRCLRRAVVCQADLTCALLAQGRKRGLSEARKMLQTQPLSDKDGDFHPVHVFELIDEKIVRAMSHCAPKYRKKTFRG